MVVCTHNGAARLPTTLAHLATQKAIDHARWEVIVVDNASADGSARVAQDCWPPAATVSFRVIEEPRLGLSIARLRGLAEARYEIVSFVDDDNWLADDWVATVAEVMSANPDLGAIGSLSYPVCETDPPRWFAQFQGRFYAVLTEADLSAVTLSVAPAGAGLSIRKSAWEEMVRGGFSFLATDACGSRLSRGGDWELGIELGLCGWKLGIEPRLRLKHFMPAHRLKWSYLRRLARESAASTVVLDGYNLPAELGLKGRLRQTWLWQAMATAKLILRHPATLVLSACLPMEGSTETIEMECWIGRLSGLLELRGRYNDARRAHAARERARRVTHRQGTQSPTA